MTKKELKKLAKSKKYLELVHTLECSVSGQSQVSAHHIRPTGTGMGMKSPDYWAIPLHFFFHQGPQGIHTIGTRAWESLYGSQIDHARKTQALLADLIDIPEEFRL